jgi:catechol 2,3-dioxygenase-like lactoylglutathione lyase family enzyme
MRRATLALLLFTVSYFGFSQQRPAITGIAFVRMYASNMAASEDFYDKTLGYDHVTRNGILTYLVSDSQSLQLVPLPSPAPQARVAAIGFTTRNVRGLEKYLEAHSIKIDQPLSHGSFAVRDPEGHLVYFVQQRPASTKVISPRAASHRIIHTGFTVQDTAAENTFWRDLLGFTPYWHGGHVEGVIDWVSSQVPNGTDWIEYMLNSGPNPNPHQLGSDYHFSLGTEHMSDVLQVLARNHCQGPNCTKTQMGRDGKVQLNLFDPDLTRVEFMEFKPTGDPCCSTMTGNPPTETENR